ncbi:septum formation initiator family protein [Rhodococcus sp. NPDC058505]|uniref:FtsB family cell division protein n=1 Tax=unclassified Rhodococcus (in: high G+C Gram-positive bacteria) TaxID=192944 RepID=UPI00365BDAD7
MSQRGRSRPGGSPGGREPRRQRDGDGTRRSTSRTRPSGPAAPGSTGAAGQSTPPSPTEKPVGGARSRRRPTAPQPERTVLGLSTARAVILAMVICVVALTVAVPLRTYLGQRSEAEQVAEQRRQLEADVDQLTRDSAQADDPAYVRAQARERLQYVMPGETPYQVQLPGATAPPVEDLTKPKHDGDPWYTDLWRPIVEPQPTPTPPPAPPPAPPASSQDGAGSMTIPQDQGGPTG